MKHIQWEYERNGRTVDSEIHLARRDGGTKCGLPPVRGHWETSADLTCRTCIRRQSTTKTQDLVARIRAVADALESVADQFPDLYWAKAFDGSPWNPLKPMGDFSWSRESFMIDPDNAHRATVSYGTVLDGTGRFDAFVEVFPEKGQRILVPVVRILDLKLVSLDHVRKAAMAAADLLTGKPKRHLHCLISRAIRKNRERKEREAQALRERLAELEGSPGGT